MKIVIGGRQSGKTAALIKESADTGRYILVTNKQRQRQVFDQARDMGYDIPFPVTLEDYFRSHFRGSSLQRDGILIDDMQDVLQYMFSGVPVVGVTWNVNPGELEMVDK